MDLDGSKVKWLDSHFQFSPSRLSVNTGMHVCLQQLACILAAACLYPGSSLPVSLQQVVGPTIVAADTDGDAAQGWVGLVAANDVAQGAAVVAATVAASVAVASQATIYVYKLVEGEVKVEKIEHTKAAAPAASATA
jgi:hypothetical protein